MALIAGIAHRKQRARANLALHQSLVLGVRRCSSGGKIKVGANQADVREVRTYGFCWDALCGGKFNGNGSAFWSTAEFTQGVHQLGVGSGLR